MKILHLNYTDAGGGAAIAALKLVEAQNRNGIEATLGVIQKTTYSPFVISVSKKRNIFSKLYSGVIEVLKFIFIYLGIYNSNIPCIFFKTSNGILHSKNSKSLADINFINNSDFDIVHLHWINFNMISIKDIAKIKKPIIWTMHDSWPFCGAEHHPNVLEHDERYKTGYYRSNKPASTKGIDLCRYVWNEKRKYLQKKEIVFISPSSWERDCLKQSKIFSDKQCFVIPNVISKDVFKPLDKLTIRKLLNIPVDKKILGFGAAYDIDNPKGIKGSYYLLKALENLQNPEEYFLVIFGSASEVFTSKLKIDFFNSGFIHNQNILSMLYNACDVFILPSLIENLPTTALESIHCGVPVAAFDVGGTKDIVEHCKNGYLAKPYDADDLREGIKYCISNYDELSANCLKKAEIDFNNDSIIKHHLEVYNAVINSIRKLQK